MRTALLVIVLALVCSPVRAQSLAYDDRHRISVTGDAVVNVAPDRIIVSFGIDTRHPTLLTAKQQNDTIAKDAIAAVKRLGIPDRDIQTDQLSISQRFGDRQVFVGYTVRNMFAVTVNDPGKVEELISSALGAGVNYLLGVDFQSSELKKYREQAREQAVRAAREKAEKMAAALGQTVGKPIQIAEVQRSVGPSYNSSWSGAAWGDTARNMTALNQNVTEISGGGEAADTIALGKLGIRASVSVVFELTR